MTGAWNGTSDIRLAIGDEKYTFSGLISFEIDHHGNIAGFVTGVHSHDTAPFATGTFTSHKVTGGITDFHPHHGTGELNLVFGTDLGTINCPFCLGTNFEHYTETLNITFMTTCSNAPSCHDIVPLGLGQQKLLPGSQATLKKYYPARK